MKKHINNTSIRYELRFVSVPVKLHYYYPLSKNLFLNAGAGVTLNHCFYKGIRVSTTDMPVWTTETKDRLSKNLSFNFSVGINYFITRKVGISFDPFFKIDRNYGDFYFSSKVKYYSLGAKVGLTF